MKVKISLKCLNCGISEENSFIFDTDKTKPMHFKCKKCEGYFSIKVEEYDR